MEDSKLPTAEECLIVLGEDMTFEEYRAKMRLKKLREEIWKKEQRLGEIEGEIPEERLPKIEKRLGIIERKLDSILKQRTPRATHQKAAKPEVKHGIKEVARPEKKPKPVKTKSVEIPKELKEVEKFKREDVQKHFKVSLPTACRYVKSWIKEKKVEMVGEPKSNKLFYKVIPK